MQIKFPPTQTETWEVLMTVWAAIIYLRTGHIKGLIEFVMHRGTKAGQPASAEDFGLDVETSFKGLPVSGLDDLSNKCLFVPF